MQERSFLTLSDEIMKETIYKFKNIFIDASKFDDSLKIISSDEDFYNFSKICLQLYYMNNFCGPLVPKDEIMKLFGLDSKNFDDIELLSRNNLTVNGEVVCLASNYNFLLWISSNYLNTTPSQLNHHLQHILIYLIWSHVIGFPISTFRNKCFIHIQKLISNIDIFESKDDKVAVILICLQAFLIFKEYDKSEELISYASSILQIDVKLTGILGKRTKYQLRELPQMVLDVDVTGEIIGQNPDCLPEDVTLDDDTLLPKIQLSMNHHIPSLSCFHQSLLLMICYYKIHRYPSHELTNEELLPFITAILNNPQTYTIGRFALYYRSFFERDSNRKIERTLLQLENLTKEYLIYDNSLKLTQQKNRLTNWHLIIFLPFWDIKKMLGETFYRMGCVKSALDQYSDLKSFDDLVSCYITLGRREKAEELIKKEIIKSGKNPQLLCLLGQINDDDKYYNEALELSNFKSFRAFYQLGYYHLNRKNYIESIEYLEKALNINTIQPRTWYNLGCAYLEIGSDIKAAKAFKTCCNLDPSNFKAWTNLASIFMRQKNLDSSYRSILNAISCHYDNEKTWEMYAHVSMLMEKPNDLIRCLNRLVELAPTINKDEIVEYLVIYSLNSKENEKLDKFKQNLINSIEKWSKKNTISFKIWWMLAKLQINKNIPFGIVLESFECSIRELIYNNKESIKSPHQLEQAFKLFEDLYKYLNENNDKTNDIRHLEFKNSTTKTIDNLIQRLNNYLIEIDDQISIEFQKLIKKINELKCQFSNN